jgi:X-Pro dipeptidyl-peptidase
VPISGISDLYRYNFVNGVPINVQGFGFNTYYWAIVGLGPAGLSGGTQLLDPAHIATAGAGEVCTDQAQVQEGGVSSTIDGNKDAYWQLRDFGAEYLATPDKERAAVFFIHGLQDWNVKPHMMEGWLDLVQQSGVPYKVWLGQWGHAWPQGAADCLVNADTGKGSACRHDWWETVMVAWFDQFLKGIDTGILDAPAVQVQDDDGQWRHEAYWPDPAAERRRFHLGSGTLGAAPGTGASSYFDARGGLLTLPIETGATSAEWVSEPFAADATLTGMPVFHGNVTATGQRASLVLSLMEQLPDGTRRSFNFCALSLNHAASLEAGTSDISGLRQEVHVACFPQDDVVHAGSRLVLVASGNTLGGPGPGLQPIADGSTITIEHEGAWLEIAVDTTTVYEQPQPYDKP